MGQTLYTVDIGEDNIATLAAGLSGYVLSGHVRSLGQDVILDETAVQWLRDLYEAPTRPGGLDGFVDHRDTMWIGGASFPLTEVEEDHLFTVRVDGPVEGGAWDVAEAPHLVFGDGTARDVADDVASAEEDRPAPFRVLVWHGVGEHGEPAGIANVDDEDGA